MPYTFNPIFTTPHFHYTPISTVQFIIRTDPDPIFERQGDDLLLNHTISLLDALVGFSHEVGGCVGVVVVWGWVCGEGLVELCV